MPTEGPYILLYDRDCRFCAASARWAKALDLRGRLRVQPIQASRDLLPQLQEEQILDAMHVIDAEGRVSTGGDSLPPLLEALLAGPPLGELIRSSRGMMRALRRAYEVIVRLRGHLVCRFDAASPSQASTPR